MINKIILFTIIVGDYFHKKKIIKFLKNKGILNIDILVDVGAHKGESISFFLRNFNIRNIYSFEPIPHTFNKLKSKLKYFSKIKKNCDIKLENSALGKSKKKIFIKKMIESSSSTIKEINTKSKYFNRKKKLLYSGKKNFFEMIEINQIKLSDYMQQNSIKKIDFLKIDTEGYEYDVLKGMEEKIVNTKLIMFEHHYHDMIKKNYTYSDIHNYLIKEKFVRIYKSKMPFRRTFEYIYENNN